MTLSRRRFISITAGMALGGLGTMKAPVHAETALWHGIALGADARLVITGLPKIKADRLIMLARAEIERFENIFSIYRPQSLLSTLNATGLLALPSPELLTLFSMVGSIHSASNGMFDPTIQPLWSTYAEHKGRPPKALIGELTRRVGWQHVHSDAQSVRFAKTGMAVTLNGIAQGFITDRITQLFKAEGISSAVVKLGEISAIGRNSSNEPWQIGIAQSGDKIAEDFVQLTNQAIATSSPFGTTFNGKASHIIDPKSGLPARSKWQRISVIHTSAAIADGLSTAAILMDQNQIEKMLTQTNGVEMIAKSSNGKTFSYHS